MARFYAIQPCWLIPKSSCNLSWGATLMMSQFARPEDDPKERRG
ncbi:MAG: hypothetical protein ACI35Z_08215 [Sphingobacterium hotanense]